MRSAHGLAHVLALPLINYSVPSREQPPLARTPCHLKLCVLINLTEGKPPAREDPCTDGHGSLVGTAGVF